MYPVYQEGKYYYFNTNNGVIYRCFFTKSQTGLYGVEIKSEVLFFEFDIFNGNAIKPDRNIRPTIVNLLEKFFNQNKTAVITFICSDTDSRAIKRLRLFYNWFNKSKEKKDKEFIKVEFEDFFAGIIFLKQNPERHKIQTTIEEIKIDVSQK